MVIARIAAQQRLHQAQDFLDLLLDEGVLESVRHADRSKEVHRLICDTGTYSMEFVELEHAARIAWRNNNRCIGRLPWKTLMVRDCRALRHEGEVFQACVDHLRLADHRGQIRPLITVFQSVESAPKPIRFWNLQLIRYAGWLLPNGAVLGDPLHIELTAAIESLGWMPPNRTRFTVLPVVIQLGSDQPRVFQLPTDAVLEVPIVHPELPWFADLGLRWHAVPMLSGMALEAGGLTYSAAPFNGWYMGTEIGSRNFGDSDRYDQLPTIATRMGLDTSRPSTLWRDRALVELNIAVLFSFRAAGVKIVDHHSAAHQFMTHIEREKCAGRETTGDWSWLVPPLSGSSTPVFHRYYPTGEVSPRFAEQQQPWPQALSRGLRHDDRVARTLPVQPSRRAGTAWTS